MAEKKYTESQKMAIEWNDGPVIVLAGPGSGKTAVLTERIKRILLNSQDQSFAQKYFEIMVLMSV